MSLPPVLFHIFPRPLPYSNTWLLQERIHQLQLALRRSSAHPDVLLILQHRPTYTSGRRQTEPSIADERRRLQNLGADFIPATRGGQLTYHGPGQIVGYPLVDLSRYRPTMGARDYVCRLQNMLKGYLKEEHGITPAPSEHTGVFLDDVTKIASIGVQVRHRLTSHGFAINISQEPLSWFNKIVACGLDDVKAGSIQSHLQKPVSYPTEAELLVRYFGKALQRDMVQLDVAKEGEIGQSISELEDVAASAGSWLIEPRSD
ncbi:hypothetical protein D9613_002061 [Agrocybe pediades]|uniref:Octanoyltransferase n=1 Tax=Agrocybe pediades TaxID=84607 RepID=A0A8H4R721_9AGAR|nr:hypothetical protein D9613_002061 [Agrocybe pediades]KAF9569849.1 lipoyltransferase [Agrocybe pediades]